MELIFNVFLFFENETCSKAGIVSHEHDGTDEEGLVFLQSKLSDDFKVSKMVDINNPFSLQEYNSHLRIGTGGCLYDEVFSGIDAGPNPLLCVTPVKNGSIYYEHSTFDQILDMNEIWKKLGDMGVMEDWLVKYTNKEGINLPKLIDDDYFLAIKLNYNAGHYVSAMKLLLTCIDSIAYIDLGEQKNPCSFIAWLDAYADLSTMKISSQELWELRNGLLHMTNLDSKKVRSKQVRRISFRVGLVPNNFPSEVGDVFLFDFNALINAINLALQKWIESYNIDRTKFVKFVERYDLTISDSRVSKMHSSKEA